MAAYSSEHSFSCVFSTYFRNLHGNHSFHILLHIVVHVRFNISCYTKRKKITARNTLGHHINCDNCQGKVLGNMAAFLRELKMAKTYFIIVVLAFVCFLPTGIVLFGFKEPWDESEKERGAMP